MWEPLGILSGELWVLWVLWETLCICEWSVHPHDEGRGGGTTRGVLPLGMAVPLSYKRRRWRAPLLTHLSCSHMPFGWHLLPLASWSTSRASAYEKHCSKFSPPPPLCRSVAGVPEDPLLLLPNWSKVLRSSSDRTCDRVRRRCLFVVPSSRPWGRACTLYTIHVSGTLFRFRSSRVSPSKPLQVIS